MEELEILKDIPKGLISAINAIGLPILSYAIFVMYRALIRRTSFLQSSLKDMKDVYGAVIDTAKRRSSELEALIENQSKFNELYLKMVTDSTEHVEKVKEWKKSEITILEERMNTILNDLEKANIMINQLKQDNINLNKNIKGLKTKLNFLNQEMGFGESMAKGHK